MSIEYSYEIIRVDEAARCMEVVFKAKGNPTMHIGARLPYEGETLEQVMAMYAPLRYWEELKTPVVVPEVGTTGVIVPEPPVVSPSVNQSQPTTTGAQTL